VAGAIVYHAKILCDHVNTLWRLLDRVLIPVTELTDTRDQNKATFSTESIARLYIYQTHTAEFLYVPATDEEVDGNYAVFVTNRNHVAPDEIRHVVNSYSRRWDIENQYKSVKAFLPKTSSKDYRVRLFSFTFAALLYNLWRLTDHLVKVGMGRDIRSPPVVTAKTFVRAVGRYLREGG